MTSPAKEINMGGGLDMLSSGPKLDLDALSLSPDIKQKPPAP